MNKLLPLLLLFYLSACAQSRYYFQKGEDVFPVEKASIHLKEFPYPEYLKGVISKIDHNLVRNSNHKLNAVFHFKISKDGSICKNDISIIKSSEDDLVNQQVVVAILNSAPFDPLPIEYKEDTLDVYLGNTGMLLTK